MISKLRNSFLVLELLIRIFFKKNGALKFPTCKYVLKIRIALAKFNNILVSVIYNQKYLNNYVLTKNVKFIFDIV